MKKTFDEYFAVLFGNETLKSDPHKVITDSGGLTKYGISDLADKLKDGKYFGEDIKTMTVGRAKEIYRKEYFEPFAAKFVDFPNLSLNLFDVSVNSGVGKAKEMLTQLTKSSVLNTQIETLKIMGDNEATKKFQEIRKKFYESLVNSNPSKYGAFKDGWLNRIKKTLFL